MFTFYNASVFEKQYPKVTFSQLSNGFTDVCIYDDGVNISGGYYLNNKTSSAQYIFDELLNSCEKVGILVKGELNSVSKEYYGEYCKTQDSE